jgi:hypothetical protein
MVRLRGRVRLSAAMSWAGLVDQLVEPVMMAHPGSAGVVVRAAGERLSEAVPECLPLLAQLLDLLALAATCRQPGCQAFQLGADQIAVLDVTGFGALDPQPAARPGLDHADDLQAA